MWESESDHLSTLDWWPRRELDHCLFSGWGMHAGADRGFIENSGISDSEKMAQYLEEERHMREENLRLQRKLQREMERREALCRQLSESESSLEMDDERCVQAQWALWRQQPKPRLQLLFTA